MSRVISWAGLCLLLALTSFGEGDVAAADRNSSVDEMAGTHMDEPAPPEEGSEAWRQWEDIRIALEQERYIDAMAGLDRLQTHYLDHGIQNDPAVAWAILRAAKQAGKKGNHQQSLELIRYAREIAPVLPAPYFMSARLFWDSDVRSFGEMVGDVATGLSRGWAFLPTRMEWLSRDALFEDSGLDRREIELRVAALRSRPFRQQLHDARRIAADLPARDKGPQPHTPRLGGSSIHF